MGKRQKRPFFSCFFFLPATWFLYLGDSSVVRGTRSGLGWGLHSALLLRLLSTLIRAYLTEFPMG
ncbi:hypothetical protein F5Y00DRAFT_237984 [Daldinia vernicosa]|uniref:uncharacterized protein n=1 Tax=Daldinia vernicosa TaxID=114800 RepID=UPI0020074B26|nr:uncharacterized protein F5Y00DRAFT_237984 [Daldinia vernicosa]KAI0848639.1 hypothetical protein F5Y00DRAFT_237984 [Daldinia vernicosa]